MAWYADVLLDIKQLVLFARTAKTQYLLFNLAGMAAPVILSMHETVEWFNRPASPALDSLRHTTGMSLNVLMGAMLGGIALQLQMLLLTLWSAKHRTRHPLLAGTKHAEAQPGKGAIDSQGRGRGVHPARTHHVCSLRCDTS